MDKRGPKPKKTPEGVAVEPGMPSEPSWLDKRARVEWVKMCSLLMGETRLLTVLDGNVLGVYCQSVSDYDRACREIAKHGMLIPAANNAMKPNPALTAKRDAVATLLRTGSLLGLSPADRASLKLPTGEKDEGEGVSTGDFLAGGQRVG